MQIHFLVDVFAAIGAAFDLKVPNILRQKDTFTVLSSATFYFISFL